MEDMNNDNLNLDKDKDNNMESEPQFVEYTNVEPEPPKEPEVQPENTNYTQPQNDNGYYTVYNQPNQTTNYSAPYYNNQTSPQNPPPYQGSYYYTGTPDNNNTPNGNGKNKKSSKNGIKVLIAVVAVIIAVAIGFCIKAFIDFAQNQVTPPSGPTGDGTVISSAETPDKDPTTTGEKLTAEEIAEIGRKSNVGVLVYSNSGYSAGSSAGEGTGIVAQISKDGKSTYILTCAHVISDPGISVKILLEDGTTYDAAIVGYDQQTDVGVLRVSTTDLTCATFGDFSKLKVGSPVYAVGNPGGSEFFGSFTNGIVSAISRSINNEIGYTMECIQHNAAINPGNSGGALFNEYGQVIGINSSKIASTEYEGMSFSIPISTALEVANNIIAQGYVPNRPKLGISYSLASSHNTYAMIVQIKDLPAGSLIIRSISSDSSLKDSDVQIGDMITAVNGQRLDTADILLDIIDQSKVGDKLKLDICRVNTDYSIEEFTITVELVEDKGSTSTAEEETTYVNPYDYFNQYSGGYGN